MRISSKPEAVIDQGEPTRYGQWMFDHPNPMTHLASFEQAPAIAFECAGNDLHINSEHAVAFKAALEVAHPDAAKQVRIRIHPDLDHFGAGHDPQVEDACLEWLLH